MHVCPSVNQLCAHADTVSDALDAPFQHILNAELLRDLAKVACCRILVLHHTCSTNYFQVGDLSEVRKDFILDTIRKEGILLISAQVFKRKHGDRFFGYHRGR